jgi:hypothetical protein
MLHVTNGDVAVERIRQSAVGGAVIPWQDALNDGPVPAGLDPGQLRDARARFIADEGWGVLEDVRAELASRDATLDVALGPVVLWFEHDLYDQLQVLQVLDRLSDRWREGLVVEAIDAPTYLGLMGPDTFSRMYDLRDEVLPAVFELASAAWAAFRAPDPTRIERLLDLDTSALPHLDPALRRHLEEFPSVESGLSRTERQALEALAGGARTVREAFPAAHHAREEAVFLGDVGFVTILRRLSEATAPLLRRVDGETLRAVLDPVRGLQKDLLDADLVLTETGEAVLGGDLDHVAHNGLDRWLGGVHLAGHDAWRWDASAARLIRGGQ